MKLRSQISRAVGQTLLSREVPLQLPQILKCVYFNWSGLQIANMQHWTGQARISLTIWSTGSVLSHSLCCFYLRDLIPRPQ